MGDLVLQDFWVLSTTALVELLSDERKKIFGEEESRAKRKEDNRAGSRPFAGSVLAVEEPGGRNVGI
jgi:hypothetical protein